jgi:uncharacterized protein DUF4135
LGELLWETKLPAGDPGSALSPAASGFVRAIRSGQAGELFPPWVDAGPDGTAAGHGFGTGSDARLVSHLLTRPRFAPLADLVTQLDDWCQRTAGRFGELIDRRVLVAGNGDLFGPLVTRAFIACATRPSFARRFVPAQRAAWESFLTDFFVRLRNDTRAGRLDDLDFTLPVLGVRAEHTETHNGCERVLRLEPASGRRLAYKPRHAGAETLFLAPADSVFALLNSLPGASGEVRLPVLAGARGHGPYLWQEWVEPPASWGVIRRSGDLGLHGTLLRPEQADRFWHRAGSLAAACFAFGIADLGEGNLLTGPGEQPLYHPVDLEVCFADTRRLYDTYLVAGSGQHHHCGMERTARWCTVDGPLAGLVPGGDSVRLRRIDRPWLRRQTRTVVADTRGRTGYGPYLAAFLRGMFDAWTLMCRNRERIAALLDRTVTVRVLLRDTALYQQVLDDRLLTGRASVPARFCRGEAEQLRRGDVPYFFRSTRGGPLSRWDPTRKVAVATRVPQGRALPPFDQVRRGERLTLAGLGAALRDAVAYVRADLDRPVDGDHGVRLRSVDADTGEVSFDWPRVHKQVTYSWDPTTVRLRLDELVGAP